MKIGFPLLEKTSTQDLKFDRTLHGSNYFGVYNTDTDQINIIASDTIAEDQQGRGFIHFLKSENIASVISPECHTMAAKFFSDNEIDIYKASSPNIYDNIIACMKNELLLFTGETAIQKKDCSGTSCSDCSSTCSDTDNVDQQVISI